MLNWPMIALGWVVNLFERGEARMGRINALLDARWTSRMRESARGPASRVAGAVRISRPHLRLRRGRAGAPRHRPRGARGDHGRDRGAHRLRQEHAREPHPPPLRSAARHPARGRHGRARAAPRHAAGRGGLRAAGDVPVLGHPARERGLRPARRRRAARRRSGRPRSPSSRGTCATSPRATTPSWASAASPSPAARSSARPWPAPSPPTRASWCSTTRCPRWTRRPRRRSCGACARS